MDRLSAHWPEEKHRSKAQHYSQVKYERSVSLEDIMFNAVIIFRRTRITGVSFKTTLKE